MDIFSKQELQRLDFELEDMEKYHDIDDISYDSPAGIMDFTKAK